jgi:hypothetical protein
MLFFLTARSKTVIISQKLTGGILDLGVPSPPLPSDSATSLPPPARLAKGTCPLFLPKNKQLSF